MKIKRLAWAKKYISKSAEFWNNIFYSDETYFEINMNSVMNRIRRFKSSNPFASNLISGKVKHPTKVMVWGCFSRFGLGRICVLDGYMNSCKYVEVLEEKLLPSILSSPIESPIHLDDSASCHRTRKIKDWHSYNNISQIDWPGNSPDLIPIENLWGFMKNKIKRRVIKNKRALIENILQIWREEIPTSLLEKLCDSMPSRLQNTINLKGCCTKY